MSIPPSELFTAVHELLTAAEAEGLTGRGEADAFVRAYARALDARLAHSELFVLRQSIVLRGGRASPLFFCTLALQHEIAGDVVEAALGHARAAATLEALPPGCVDALMAGLHGAPPIQTIRDGLGILRWWMESTPAAASLAARLRAFEGRLAARAV